MGDATSGAPAYRSAHAGYGLKFILQRDLLRLRRKRNLAATPATKQPDGQITKSLSSPSRKNIPIAASGKSGV
jgi:hypothetical protein